MENKIVLDVATTGTGLLEYTDFILDGERDGNRASDSAVKATEVYQKLKNNYWLLRDTRYYIQGGADSKYDYQIRFSEFGENNLKSGEIDSINDMSDEIGFPIISYIDPNNITNVNKSNEYSHIEDFKTSVEDMVDDLYSSVFGDSLATEKIFYDSSKTRVSLCNNTESNLVGLINLITPGSDEYTNRVSLGPLLKSNIFHPGAKCILDLVINYSRGSIVYTKSAIVTLFVYDSGIVKNSIDMIIDDELRLYLDQDSDILSLSKLDTSINEYIIEGCTAKIMI